MPSASNVLCGCGRFMAVKKNGVTVEELLEDGGPYKLWDADLYECPECGIEVFTGFAKQPLAEHYQPTYQAERVRLTPIYAGRCAPVPEREEPRDEAYERAAARYEGFPDKDWR